MAWDDCSVIKVGANRGKRVNVMASGVLVILLLVMRCSVCENPVSQHTGDMCSFLYVILKSYKNPCAP